MLGRWSAPVRLARRTARRSPGRTLLIAALIGLPVLAAGWVALIQSSTAATGERLARQHLGAADALVTVTTSPEVTIEQFMSAPWIAGHADPATPESPRDPAAVDVAPLLPPGTTVVPGGDGWSTAAAVRTPNAVGNYSVQGIDGANKLTKGMYRLDSGRMPSGPEEAALSPALADHLGVLRDGSLPADATMITTDGHRYTVVGLARLHDDPDRPMVWAAPDTRLAPRPHDTDLSYLVDLPAGIDVPQLQQRLAGSGLVLTPRAWVIDPPEPEGMPMTTDEAAGWAAVALVIGFGVLEIVLLAGTAFAVGARRQTRELGLVTASGGTASDVRRIVLAQGLVLGVVGTTAGVALAIIAVVAGRPVWERLLNQLVDGWSVPVVPLVVIAGIGVFAGLAAAVVPALSASRQEPVAALAQRFTVARGNGRLRRPALVLLAAGVGLALLGTSRLGAAFAEAKRQAEADPYAGSVSVTPVGPIALVLAGITAVIAALVWLLPNLVAKAATVGRVLPLSGRMALRDAARHRHRTGPAAAAIMMAVGGTVAIAFAMANAFAAERANYVPAAPEGTVVVSYDQGMGQPGVPRWKEYSPGLVEQLTRRLPVREHYDLGTVQKHAARPLPNSDGYIPRLSITSPVCTATTEPCGPVYLQLTVIDPDYLDRLGGFGPQTATALRAGRIVITARSQELSRNTMVTGGSVAVGSDDMLPTGKNVRRVPAAVVPDLPRMAPFDASALVSPQLAARLGDVRVTTTHFELTRPPTDAEMTAATTVLGNEDTIMLERGYQSHAGAMFLALLSAATVVTLLGVAIAVALSAAEGRADLATLAAVGAPPRRRRGLAAAQAWLVGEIGCVLGVGVGALYGYTAHVAFGSASMVVPWRELAGILVAVPLFAALLAWLLTRSRLPMVRRVG